MKALAVFPSTRETRLIDHPEPVVERPTDVKLRVLEAGICGTDREITSFEYGAPPAGSPYLIIGHEALGEVIEVGTAVVGLAPGDLAVLTVRRPCPHAWCGPCRHGRQDFCITGDFTERGIKEVHGYMTEFVVDDEQYVVKVPRELRDVAVLIEPLTVAEKAAEQTRILTQRLPGDLKNDPSNLNAMVLGAGPIGLLGAMKMLRGGFNTWVYSMDKPGSPNVNVVEDIGARVHLGGRAPAHRPGKDSRQYQLHVRSHRHSQCVLRRAERAGRQRRVLSTGRAGDGGTGRNRRKAHHAEHGASTTRSSAVPSMPVGPRSRKPWTISAGSCRPSPMAVRALITSRTPLEGAREAVLTPGGIKNVVTIG